MADNPGVVEEAELVEEAKIVYESDLRAASGRNGRAAHLVEPTKVAGDPPSPPTVRPDHDHGREPDPSRLKNVVLGLVYLGAGGIAITIGALMLKDAFRGGRS